jgi:hypothetical protein
MNRRPFRARRDSGTGRGYSWLPYVDPEVVEHLASSALAAFDGAVEVALAERRSVFASEMDTILRFSEEPPINVCIDQGRRRGMSRGTRDHAASCRAMPAH